MTPLTLPYYLDVEAANAEVARLAAEIALLRGALMQNQKQIEILKARNAALELVAKSMSQLCHYRRGGFCRIECLGSVICDTSGLMLLPWYELPEKFRENT